MCLQPLVENCFKHGFSDEQTDARIEINGRLIGTSIFIEVRDNGRGIKEEDIKKREEGGIGIENIARRLELVYGRKCLSIKSDNGTVITIEFPQGEEYEGINS